MLWFWSGFPGWPQQTAVLWQSCRWVPAGSPAATCPQWSGRTELQRCGTRSPRSRNPARPNRGISAAHLWFGPSSRKVQVVELGEELVSSSLIISTLRLIMSSWIISRWWIVWLCVPPNFSSAVLSFHQQIIACLKKQCWCSQTFPSCSSEYIHSLNMKHELLSKSLMFEQEVKFWPEMMSWLTNFN